MKRGREQSAIDNPKDISFRPKYAANRSRASSAQGLAGARFMNNCQCRDASADRLCPVQQPRQVIMSIRIVRVILERAAKSSFGQP